MVTFWAILKKFRLRFISASGHTDIKLDFSFYGFFKLLANLR